MVMQVYGFWRSIASFRVRTALALKGMPFEEISIDILSGEQFKSGYSEVNAEHVVPTLIHDGHSLFQSLAIIEYLDDIQPAPRLMPEDIKERAYVRAVSLVAIADSHPLIVPRVRKHLVKTFGADNHAVETWATHWTLEGLATFERLLERRPAAPFVAGAAVSAADVCIAGQVVSAHLFKIDLAAYPAVSQLADRCFALPAFALSHPFEQPGFKNAKGSH
jgi:maleylacetoacetate isomerase